MSGHMKRVLVLDNNEAELSKLERSLGAGDFHVVGTWSGRTALELLATQNFDALVVDDYIPDMHVDEFLGLVAKTSAKPFILLMTAEPNLKDTKRLKNLKVTKVADKRLITSIPQTIALILEMGCEPDHPVEPQTQGLLSDSPRKPLGWRQS